MKRIYRFICSCIRLRSIARGRWIDAYDQAGTKK